ncbi:MAG TPA: diguanylate cyclase [Candidatus Baltobacteraceae bacterium]|nr:diguanylate cyclase [Candidatus Baltobacteraceae bacterium]
MRAAVPAAVLLTMLLPWPLVTRAASPHVLDPAKTYTLGSIAQIKRDGGSWLGAGRFVSSQSASLFDRHTILFRLAIMADPDTAWVIQAPQQIDDIELIDPAGTTITTGMDVPVLQRPIHNRLPILPVPAHLLHGTPFLVRMVTSTEVREPLLRTAAAMQTEEDGTRAVTFFFIGFFVAVGLVFGLLYWNLRERGLLLYSFVMFSLAVFEAINKAYAWQYVWPELSLQWHVPNALAFWLYYAALVAFCSAFLSTAGTLVIFRRASWLALAVNFVTLMVGAAFHDLPGVPAVEDLAAAAMLAILLAWAVAAYRGGQRSARYYVVAFVGVFAGILINRLALDQAIAHTAFTEWILEIGIAWEALWLALAIASSLQEATRENALLHASEIQLQRLATIDGLTSVANRRAFDDRLQAEWNRAARSQRQLALLFADVDYFKEFNDTQGHLAGDDCLRRIAFSISKYAARASDLCARYGGEEFAALIPEVTLEAATELAESIRLEVQQLRIPHPTSPVRYVTISIGVACAVPTLDLHHMRLIADADRALYQAKHGGRNRVVSVADLV